MCADGRLDVIIGPQAGLAIRQRNLPSVICLGNRVSTRRELWHGATLELDCESEIHANLGTREGMNL